MKNFTFPTELPWKLLKQKINQPHMFRSISVFLVQFHCSVSMLISHHPDYCSFILSLAIKYCKSSNLGFFFFQKSFGHFVYLESAYQIPTKKIPSRILIQIAIDSIDQFGRNWHLNDIEPSNPWTWYTCLFFEISLIFHSRVLYYQCTGLVDILLNFSLCNCCCCNCKYCF